MTSFSVYNTSTEEDINVLPVSFAQQRLWFLDQLEPNSATYNLFYTVRISIPLDVPALEQSLNTILKRHAVLRTTFGVKDEQPVQVISPTLHVPLPVVDLRSLPEGQREAEVRQLMTEETQRPFDLARGPLLRTTLFQLGVQEWVLLLTIHPIVFDNWSIDVFFQELVTIYEAFINDLPSPLPDLPIQYGDFALWQRERLQGAKLEEQLDYWKQQLEGAPSALELPTDRPRLPKPMYPRSVHRFVLHKRLRDALEALSHQEGVTLFMTLVATFQTLLHRYSEQDDLVIGTMVSQRNSPQLQGLLGFFLNTLVLRTNLSGNPTFRELLARVREVVLDAYAHQDVPFEYLVKELRPEQSLGQNPFFQVLLTMKPALPVLPSGWAFTQMHIETSGAAQFDLSLELDEGSEGLIGRLEYNLDLFDATTIARMMEHWQTLLESIGNAPNQHLYELPLLTEAEREQLLVEWNATQTTYPRDRCVHQLFEEQVERTPDAVALIFEAQRLTYRELNTRANQLAHHLQQLGVGPEVRVGLCVERSLEMVVALFGILKAGGAYVPLDPAYPTERLTYMLEDAQVPVLVTQQGLAERLSTYSAAVVCLDSDKMALAQQSETNVFSTVTSDNLAYVIYTSGSTGRPKGVQVLHRGVTNFLLSMRQKPGMTADDVLLAVTTLSFDIAALELFLPLIVGARVVVAGRDVITNGTELVETLSSSRATVMQATPITWRILLASGWQGSPRLKVLCGGEALPRELAQQLLPRVASLWNMYGPTETTIWSTACQIKLEDECISIGRPIANTQIYLLDSHLQLVPIGVPGELYIGGDGLTRGYMNRPQLTAERFIYHPFSKEPGAMLYKTGDLARYLPDGNIECLGRLDHQVKLRGFRIELGEIEAVLSQHPSVHQAVVVARQDVPGDMRLVAYLVLLPGTTTTVAELQQAVMQQLPFYMLPAAFVLLEAFPLTPNGKIDRRALPPPGSGRSPGREAFVAPRSGLEEAVAAMFCQVLGVEQVGLHDNFFALGGHSLLAMQGIARLGASLQVEVPLRSFFDAPTVGQLAQVITQLQCQQEKPESPTLGAFSREAYRVQIPSVSLDQESRQG